MEQAIKMARKYLLFFFVMLFQPAILFALTGNEMESIANTYLNHPWTCNEWNARVNNTYDNTDDDPDNNDLKFPFFPVGAAYYDPVTGNEVIEDDGIYSGEAYANGYNHSTGTFTSNLLITDTYAGGHSSNDPAGHEYTGIDCSALVGRCNEINFNKIATIHLIGTELTDPIDEWDRVVKGDILIKVPADQDKRHVAMVINREANVATVIEAASQYFPLKLLRSKKVMKTTYTNSSGVIRRDADGGVGYSSRRITPPILERVTIRKKATNEIIYQGNWTTNATDRTLTQTANNLLIPAKPGETILFELRFSKVCAWKWPLGNAENLDIMVTCGRKKPYTEYTIVPIDIGNGHGGWDLSTSTVFDQTRVYKTWTGELVIPNDNSYNGFYHLRVKARSVTNCDLDSNLNPFFVVKLAVVKTA